MANSWTTFCVLMTSVTAFISCFLLGFSFDTLAPDKYALMFNQNTRLLECDVLYGAERGKGSRRFFTGLGRGFYEYRYPLAAQSLVFSSRRSDSDSPTIDGKTAEGANVVVEIAFQYKLPRDSHALCNMLYAYGADYDSYFVNYARSVARDAIATFLVQDMWQNREGVANALRTAVTTDLANRWATVVNFQLLSLDIPTELQNEIENTTVQAQAIETTTLNLQKQSVAAITNQLQNRVTAQIAVINAIAAGNSTILNADAKATVTNITSYAEAAGYASFQTKFGMANPQVLALAWMDALLNTAADHVAIAASVPSNTQPQI